MDRSKAIEVLRGYNAWRRYGGPIGEGPAMPDPKEVGEAVDFAIKYMSETKEEGHGDKH